MLKRLLFLLLAFAYLPTLVAQHSPLQRVFIENKGQWGEEVLYKADMPGGSVYVMKDRFRFVWIEDVFYQKAPAYAHNAVHEHDDDQEHEHDHDQAHGHAHHNHGFTDEPWSYWTHVYDVVFEGSAEISAHTAEQPDGTLRNYFIGNDPSLWGEGAQGYQRLRLEDVWAGIDIVCSFSETGFKYDFAVSAGADVQDIRFRYEGTDGLRLENNELTILSKAGRFTERIPGSFVGERDQKAIAVEYKLDPATNTVSFNVPSYDRSKTLVIDPELIFSNLSGSPADNWGYTATFDEDERAYGGGTFYSTTTASAGSSVTVPTTPGAFQTSFQGGTGIFEGTDICMLRYNADGTALEFVTYIGGNSGDQPHSIIVDSLNRTYILARTASSNFPVTTGTYDDTYNGGGDIVIARLGANGGSLRATYVGGSASDGILDNNFSAGTVPLSYYYADNFKGEIDLGPDGNVYVASCTESQNFPTTADAIQPSNASTTNPALAAVIFSLDPELDSLRFSTYWSGPNGMTTAYNLEVSDSGDVFVVGGTTSPSLLATPGTWQTTYQGGLADGWVARFSPMGDSLKAQTFVGGPHYDQTYFLDLDMDGDVYIAGHCTGTASDFPMTADTYGESQGGQFIIKLPSDLSTPEYISRFGVNDGDPDLSMTAMLVDLCENVYVSGWAGNTATSAATQPNPGAGFSYNSPQGGYETYSDTITPAFDNTFSGAGDFYFYVLERDADSLLFASYFGANQGSGEHVDGGTSRFDERGTIYQGICAACNSGNFPATGGGSQTSASGNCNLGVTKIQLDLIEFTKADFDFDISSTAGCRPYDCVFINNSEGNTENFWDYGTGDTATVNDSIHTYVFDTVGTFETQLVISNPNNNCVLNDTIVETIEVIDPVIIEAINDTSTCDTVLNFSAQISATPGVDVPLLWDFGDGNTDTSLSVTHAYPPDSVYTVTLIANAGTSCPDTMTAQVEVGFPVQSDFSVDYPGCSPVADFITNNPLDFDIVWRVNGTQVATGDNHTHTFPDTGTYGVEHVIFTDIGDCRDSTTQAVEVTIQTVADFEPPGTSCDSTVSLANLSQQASSFVWDPGDGSGNTLNTTPFDYTYPGPGVYPIQLITTPNGPCPDTLTQTFTVHPRPDAQFSVTQANCDS
ncbi:MAG: PKD domain-containing protein, partial [Bacteroidota bacterium]